MRPRAHDRTTPVPRPRAAAVRVCMVLLAVSTAACSTTDPADAYVRGHGLSVAHLTVNAEADVVTAAVHAAFDITPDLFLRLYPRRLPRTAGDSGGALVPDALVRLLRDRGVIIGTCDPLRDTPRDTPRCSGAEAGYVIRASDVLSMPADTLELYFAAEKYGAATGRKPDALRFERIYLLVKRGESWRVVREAPVRSR